MDCVTRRVFTHTGTRRATLYILHAEMDTLIVPDLLLQRGANLLKCRRQAFERDPTFRATFDEYKRDPDNSVLRQLEHKAVQDAACDAWRDPMQPYGQLRVLFSCRARDAWSDAPCCRCCVLNLLAPTSL